MPKLSDLFACTSSTICLQDAPRRPQDARKMGQGAPKTPENAPQTHPNRPQHASRTVQDAPKTAPRHPTMLSGRSKTTPRCSKTSPRRAKTLPDLDFRALAPGFFKLSSTPDPTLNPLKFHFASLHDLWPTVCQITYVAPHPWFREACSVAVRKYQTQGQ